MKLRSKTLLIVSVPFVLGVLALACASWFILRKGFQRLEEERLLRNLNRAVAALSENLDALDTLCLDWATANEMRSFLQSRDPNLLDDKMNGAIFKATNLDFAAVLDSGGHLVIARAYDERENAMVVPSQALLSRYTPPSPALLPDPRTGFRKGILLVPGGPMLLVSRPIAAGGSVRAESGVLVLGRYFIGQEIAHLVGLTHLELDLKPFDTHPLRPLYGRGTPWRLTCGDCHSERGTTRGAPGAGHKRSMVPSLGEARVATLGSKSVAGFTVLNDLFDKPTLLMSVTMDRTDYRQGLATVGAFLAALLGIGLGALLLLYLSLDRLLVSRVKGLAVEVSALDPSQGTGEAMEVRSADELEILQAVVRRTFDELSRTQGALRASQETLESQVEERTRAFEKANAELVGMVAERQKAAEFLRQSEERYRGALDNMLEGCQIIGFDWRYLYVNDSVVRHGRRSKRELLGRTVMDAYPGIEGTEMFQVLRRCMEERKPSRMENHFFYPDGSSDWFDLSFLPVPEGVFILSNEITARKQLETEREITARVLSLINASGSLPELIHGVVLLLSAWFGCDAVAVRMREGDGFPYFETCGFSPDPVPGGARAQGPGSPYPCVCEEVLGGVPGGGRTGFTERGSFGTNSSADLLGTETGKGCAERLRDHCNREGFESLALVALRVGETTYGLLQVGDRRRDQMSAHRIALLERLADYVANAVALRFGQESLRLSEERYRRLVEISPDAIYIHADGRFVFANPAGARLLGASDAHQLIGRSIGEVVHTDFHEAVRGRVENILREEGPAPLLWEKFVRLDGTTVDVEVSGVLSEFKGRKAVQVVARDVTERIRLEATRAATYEISEAAISSRNLPELYQAIHRIIGTLMDARNFYIALYEPDDDLFTYPYWVDEVDPQPEPEKPGSGLTAYVLQTGAPLLASPDIYSEMVARGDIRSRGTPAIDWLGVPLKANDRTIGVLVVQTYREGVRYHPADLEMLSFVSTQVAMAIERKRAEEALRGSEERYRALVENQGEGVTYVNTDQIFTFANPAAEEIFGVPSGRLVGRNIFEFTSPELMAETVAQSELRKRGAKSTYETQIIRPDGQRRSLLLTAVPIQDKTGAYAGNLGVFFDITGRRKTETERQLLATAIDQSSDGMLITDPEGTILYVNRAIQEMTGYDRIELLGQTPRLLRSGRQDKAFYQNFWRTILSGRVWSGRFVNRRKDGALYYSECTVSPVTDAAGALTAFVCSQRDVTKELQWEEELQRARRLETVGLLAGVVAHEVRNPLFAISTLCAALEKNLGDMDQFQPFTARIQEQVKRLGRLMSDLLMLGRPLDLARFVPCNLLDVISSALQALQEAGEGTPDRFAIRSPETLPDMLGLPDRLAQVFQNLALNALHHSPSEELIRIAITVEDNELRVTVTDLGPGIPQDLGVKVFEPFQSRRTGGTGLGLAVVKQIVEAHGGRVSAENNADGPGATFTVCLPLPNPAGPV